MKRIFSSMNSSKIDWSLWAVSIGVLVFGILLLVFPGITTSVILNVAGTALLVFGVISIVRYFLQKDNPIFSWGLGLGLFLCLAGFGLIVGKVALLAFVPMLFGIALIVAGVAKVQAACNLLRITAPRWYWTMLSAALSLILGILIIAHPFGTGLTLIRLIGASIAFESIQDMISYFSYRKVIRTHFSD